MVIYLSCLWLILFLDYSRENTCHSTFFNNLILVSYILVLRFAVGHFVVRRLFTACGISQQLTRAAFAAVSQIASAIVSQRL